MPLVHDAGCITPISCYPTGNTRRLNNLGNETWEHNDGAGFYLIMVRKQNPMIRIKINSLASNISLQDLKEVVQNQVTTM